jgi:hypothetical protein
MCSSMRVSRSSLTVNMAGGGASKWSLDYVCIPSTATFAFMQAVQNNHVL